MRPVIAIAVAVLVLCSCGGNPWTAADSKAATDQLRAQAALLSLCQGDAGCTPGQVRAVVTAGQCSLGSMLHRHGAPDLLDGGAALGCRP